MTVTQHIAIFRTGKQIVSSLRMYILIVNGFEDSSKGDHGYRIFKALLSQVVKECEVPDCYFLERRLNRLGDLVVDWEHDSLNDQSRENCKHFDKIDFVFISGDMKICPWEPLASQVVTLIHMCKFMRKPLFCNGFGAFSAIYTLATKGARFHVLNGPIGGDIEELPTFPRFSIGSGAYPSGWLDNETGDLYTYNRKHESWEPVCNLGIYRLAANGTPSSNRHAPLTKKYSRDDHLLDVNQIIEPLDEDATITRIRSVHIQHHAVLNFPAQNFISKSYQHWYIKSDGSLPAGENLHVIADSEKGAIVLSKENMILLACKIDKSASYASCKLIMKNFVSFIMTLIKEANRDKLEDSMLVFLFGADGVSGGTYDSTMAKINMSAPLARTLVRSTLPGGPVKVDPPTIGMFLYTPKQDNVDYLALTASRRKSTIGRVPKMRIQNPLFARQKRLELLSAAVGGNNVKEVAREAIAQSQKMNPAEEELEGAPEQLKELFTGIIMNTRSISTRRNRRSPSPTATDMAIPSLEEKIAAEAAEEQARITDFDREDDQYDLNAHLEEFGEALIIPGTSGSRKVKGPSGSTFEYLNRDLNASQERAQLISSSFDSMKGVSFVPDDEADQFGSDSVLSAVTINNVPFRSVTAASQELAPPATTTASVTFSVAPQQPATPRSTASASRLASQINREYRQRAMQEAVQAASRCGSPGTPSIGRSSFNGQDDDDDYEQDSSADEDEAAAPRRAAGPASTCEVSALHGGASASGWSNSVEAQKVPPIVNWNKVLASSRQDEAHTSKSARPFTQTSPFATFANSLESSYCDRPKFNQFGSLIIESSQVPRYNHNLYAPTKSSLQRSSLSSSMGVHRQVITPAVPLLPQTARSASEIESTLRKLYIPVRRPTGPITKKKLPSSRQGGGGGEDLTQSGSSLQDHSHGSFMRLFATPCQQERLHRHEDEVSEVSQLSSHDHPDPYHDSNVPQVLLPTTPSSHRPYSSYQRITRQLQEKKAVTKYEGAYTQDYVNPNEVYRKEYMKRKEKFIAGPFKTAFGHANSALEVRKGGIISGQGPYPLDPPIPMSCMPENITAVHFASMQRTPQAPLLAGTWK